MKFHESESKLQSLLLDTLILLCKNGLQFHKDLKIQGTLGVTVDEDEIVFVHIDKKLEAGLEQAEPKKSNKRTSQSKAVIPKPGKNMRKTNNGDTRTNARVSATQERAEVGEFCDDKIFFQGAELKFEKVVDEDLDMEAGNGSDANEYVQTLEIKQEVTDDECWDISAVEAVPRLDQASVEGVVGYIAAVHGDVSQELEGDDSMQEQVDKGESRPYFIKTPSGNRKAVYKGYTFTRDKVAKDKVYWRCTRRDICNARMHTDMNDFVVQELGNHILHSPVGSYTKKRLKARKPTKCTGSNTSKSSENGIDNNIGWT